MLKELGGYDWSEVFGEPNGEDTYGPHNSKPTPTALPPGSAVPLNPFSREDVVEIRAMVEGENDGPSWICVGLLRDGRFFKAEGSCDYTGWD